MTDTPRRAQATWARLDDDEATARLSHDGPNALPAAPSTALWRRCVRSLRDPLVLVLLVALTLTLATRDWTDSVVIALVILVNTSIAVREEVRAEAEVRALGTLVPSTATVLRASGEQTIPAATVVTGDLMRLRAGDLVPADAVLLEAVAMRVDEALLTGESLDIGKGVAPDPGLRPSSTGHVDSATVHSGTVVVHGHALGRVVATGAASAVGRIAAMTAAASPSSPLQRRMAGLSAQLAWLAVGLSAVYLFLGLLSGQPVRLVVLAAVALVVAAVPESLPLVVTVTLALAARRMARRRAVVRSLAAVETLGSVTLLATDKTGTLTEGRLTVAEVWVPASGSVEELMDLCVLCNDAQRDVATGRSVGSSVDAALLSWAVAAGRGPDFVRGWDRVDETPFDSVRKQMTTHLVASDGTRLTVSKGAPETLLQAVDDDAARPALTRAASWARSGNRVLAVTRALDDQAPVVAGLVSLSDPVRPSSRKTVEQCAAAGIRVVLVTGDHPGTAAAVADDVGLTNLSTASNLLTLDGRPPQPADTAADVVARARPEDKMRLVELWQAEGEVVAMTGDGVNDAPALRRADIGVAMGQRGTDVARQAADLVLTDDQLHTVVAAVEEGRRVFANIRRFLLYGLSGGGSELVLMLAGPLVGVPVPLLPAQILWVNLLTHSFAGAGLGAQPPDPAAMARPPRPPSQAVLGDGLWWRLLVLAGWLGGSSLAASVLAGHELGRSVALMCLGAGQLAVAWASRGRARGRTLRGLTADPLAGGLAVAALLLLASIAVPALRDLLGTTALTVPGSLLVAAVAFLTYLLARVVTPRAW